MTEHGADDGGTRAPAPTRPEFVERIGAEPTGTSRYDRLRRFLWHRPWLWAVIAAVELAAALALAVGSERLGVPWSVPGWLRWPLAALLALQGLSDVIVIAASRTPRRAARSTTPR